LLKTKKKHFLFVPEDFFKLTFEKNRSYKKSQKFISPGRPFSLRRASWRGNATFIGRQGLRAGTTSVNRTLLALIGCGPIAPHALARQPCRATSPGTVPIIIIGVLSPPSSPSSFLPPPDQPERQPFPHYQPPPTQSDHFG
jgi:hypothetical protein